MTDERLQAPTYLGRYAGFVTRLIAFIIDRAIVGVIAAVSLAAVHYLLNAFEINQMLGFFDFSAGTGVAVGALITLALAILYDAGFWVLAGQTPGKRLMGLRILRTDGQRIKPGNALLRLIGYILSGILFLGYIWILFDNRRQGFHDKLARTIVVYSWPEDELKGTFVHDRVQRIRHKRVAAASQDE